MEDERPPSDLSYRADEMVNTAIERARLSLLTRPEEEEVRDIDWVACHDFTVDVGKSQIEEYLRTWEMHPSWLHSLDFTGTTEQDYSTLYHYRVLWTRIPARRTAIPKGIASVHFTVEISKVRPKARPVEVRFTVGSNRLVHQPGKTRFREKWLMDEIESMDLLAQELDF